METCQRLIDERPVGSERGYESMIAAEGRFVRLSEQIFHSFMGIASGGRTSWH
jgi:hypothetical protein